MVVYKPQQPSKVQRGLSIMRQIPLDGIRLLPNSLSFKNITNTTQA